MAAQLRAAVVGCGIVTTRDILPNLQQPAVRERLLAFGQPIPKPPGEEHNYGLHILADICTWSTVSPRIGSPAPAPSTPAT